MHHIVHSKKYVEVLKASRVFQDFDELTLQKMLLEMKHKHWKAGQFFNNGSGGLHDFYIVCTGRVKEYQIDPNTGREHTFFILHEGDIFDIMNLLDNKPHDMYWETIDDVEALSISKLQMKEWISTYPIMHDDLYHYSVKGCANWKKRYRILSFTTRSSAFQNYFSPTSPGTLQNWYSSTICPTKK